ncbi:hypothetical protein PM082_020716 [Marasmius tenuissimus]|nr:hypothetical protein PM082_020716 [Marasmius tenuissimus]
MNVNFQSKLLLKEPVLISWYPAVLKVVFMAPIGTPMDSHWTITTAHLHVNGTFTDFIPYRVYKNRDYQRNMGT